MRSLYIIFIPTALYYLIFVYLPMVGVVVAFKNYNFADGVLGSPWVGFDHFSRALSTPRFWRVVRNTFLINGLRLVVGFPVPIILALLLNEARNIGFKRVVQTISYLPHFLSWIVVAGLLHHLLSPNSGVVNGVIRHMGAEPIHFMGSADWFRSVLIASGIWKVAGWSSIIYLAALSNVDVQLYEAATIDGASRWRQLFSITLPSIAPVIAVMYILAIGRMLDTGFEQVLALLNPAVASVGETIGYYVYDQGLGQSSNFGYAAAIGLFKGVVSLILIILANWGSKRINDEGGLW